MRTDIRSFDALRTKNA